MQTKVNLKKTNVDLHKYSAPTTEKPVFVFSVVNNSIKSVAITSSFRRAV